MRDVNSAILDIENLPSLPAVGVKLLAESFEADSASLDDLAEIVRSDAAISAKILGIANSPAYSRGGEVTDIADAVAKLGLNWLRNMAVSLVVIDAFPGECIEKLGGRDFWIHNLACGLAADMLAERLMGSPAPEAFAAGLLHDIGKPALATAIPRDYERVLKVAKEGLSSVIEVEDRLLSIDHCEAARSLLKKWGIPGALARPARLHHQPWLNLDSEEEDRLSFVIKSADSFCHVFGFGASGSMWPDLDERELQRSTGLSPDELDGMASRVAERLAAIGSAFDWNLSARDFLQQALRALNGRVFDMRSNARETAPLRLYRSLNGITSAFQNLETSLSAGVELTAGALAGLEGARVSMVAFCVEGEPRTAALGDSRTGECRLMVDTSEQQWDEIGSREPMDCLREMIAAVGEMDDRDEALMSWLRERELPDVMQVVGSASFGRAKAMACVWGDQDLLYRADSDVREFLLNVLPGVEARSEVLELLHECETSARSARVAEPVKRAEAATQRLETLGLLAAELAHEFNNPLGAILAEVQTLAEEIEDPEHRDSLAAVGDIVGKLAKRTRKLLGYSGRSNSTPQRIDICGVVKESLELLAPRLRDAGIRVENEIPDDPPYRVFGDPDELEQVMTNLLVNAMQASPRGAAIRLRARDVEMGRFLRIEIEDEGCGISDEQLRQIFEPFYTTKESDSGTGLGMGISKAIVESYGGRIAIESETGKGTRVLVVLSQESLAPGGGGGSSNRWAIRWSFGFSDSASRWTSSGSTMAGAYRTPTVPFT